MKKHVVWGATIVIAALSVVAVGFAQASRATTTTTLNIVNVKQEGYGTWFNVTANAYTKGFSATIDRCSGSVGYDDGQTRSVETSDDDVFRFMASRPILPGDVPHKATSISMRCQWTHRYRVRVRVTTGAQTWRNANGYYRKYGAGRAYEYLPGTLTIDNRRSSRPTTVYWKIRHPRGRATHVYSEWNESYSTPGAHPSGWTALSRTVVLAWIKVSPHMMFTVTELGVTYRHSVLVYRQKEKSVVGNGSWTAP